MVPIPNLVNDLPLTRLTNSVLVGTMKFTLDQSNLFFDVDNPAPAKLAQQLTGFSSAYDTLNSAYALTRESLITVDIDKLDHEGDQLFLGWKESVEAGQRMVYLQAKKEAADRQKVFMKKYGIDVRENMISEWSKIQQLCEEANNSLQVQADLATLGLTELLARLTEIANLLRQKLTERSAQMPAQQAMKQAREAIYPEYRLLISLLNAYALIDSDTERFQVLIAALNANIDYVKIHAMTKGEEGEEPEPEPEPEPTPDDQGGDGGEVTPVTPESN